MFKEFDFSPGIITFSNYDIEEKDDISSQYPLPFRVGVFC